MLLIILTIVVAQMVDVVVVSGHSFLGNIYLSRVIRGDRAWFTKNVSQDLLESGFDQLSDMAFTSGLGFGGWECVFWDRFCDLFTVQKNQVTNHNPECRRHILINVRKRTYIIWNPQAGYNESGISLQQTVLAHHLGTSWDLYGIKIFTRFRAAARTLTGT